MKEKIIVFVLVTAIFGMFAIPIGLSADVTVTGTFDATADLDVEVNNTAPDFGSIAVGGNNAVPLKATNVGNVTASVDQKQAVKDSGSMTLHTVYNSLGHNQYGVTFNNGSGVVDIGDSGVHELSASLAKDAEANYNLTVYIGPSLSAASYENEQFSADLDATAAT